MNKEYDGKIRKKTYNFKFVVIGQPNVGKSCLVHRYVFKKFKKHADHTLGVQFSTNRLEFEDCTINLQIWDTAGQERYRSLARSYYRNAIGMLAVYDITRQAVILNQSKESYQNLASQIEEAAQHARDDATFILVGNKVDLQGQHREVNYSDVKKECEEEDRLCLEVSAKTGDGVDQLFMLLTKQILSKIYNGKIEASSLRGKKLSPVQKDRTFCAGC